MNITIGPIIPAYPPKVIISGSPNRPEPRPNKNRNITELIIVKVEKNKVIQKNHFLKLRKIPQIVIIPKVKCKEKRERIITENPRSWRPISRMERNGLFEPLDQGRKKTKILRIAPKRRKDLIVLFISLGISPNLSKISFFFILLNN